MKTFTKVKAGPICQCGYTFSIEPKVRKRRFESYAVVSDKQYQRFLKAEQEVLAIKDEDEKFRALARSARMIGSLLECPDCGNYLLIKPGGRSNALHFTPTK